ncbi:MAG: hypothetical protein ACFCUH_00350 [Flavobacteriales bacterium]
MRYFVAFAFLFFAFGGWGQTGRQNRPLYQIGNQFGNKGWHIAPGITFAFPNQGTREDQRNINQEGNLVTAYDGVFDAGGRVGFYVEAGKHYFFDYPMLFHFVDFGIHIKQLRGTEEFNGLVLTDQGMLPVTNRGSFSDGYAGLYVNANRIVQLSDRTFLQPAIGVNADYRVFGNRRFEGVAEPFIQEFADPFQLQVHAKLGFGFAPENGVMIIPSLETPILNVVPMYDGKSTLPMFSTRYRPVILSVRILFLSRNKPADCVGKDTQRRGHQLWGDEMRRR